MTVDFEFEGQKFTALNGGFYQRTDNPLSQYLPVVIAVDDIKEAMKKVEEVGGIN